MNPLPFLRSLTPHGWLLSGIIALAAAVVIYFTLDAFFAGNAKVEAELNANRAGAAIESGADAAGTVGEVGTRASETDLITRENENAIRNAPGADAPVDPAANAAGRSSLCRRAAYRNSPECVQHPAPR